MIDARAGSEEGLAVRIRGLQRTFGDVVAVADVDLDVRRGEMLTVLGPSGCGKTTVLRLIAGLDRPDAGTIDIGGRRVAGAGAGNDHFSCFIVVTHCFVYWLSSWLGKWACLVKGAFLFWGRFQKNRLKMVFLFRGLSPDRPT